MQALPSVSSQNCIRQHSRGVNQDRNTRMMLSHEFLTVGTSVLPKGKAQGGRERVTEE